MWNIVNRCLQDFFLIIANRTNARDVFLPLNTSLSSSAAKCVWSVCCVLNAWSLEMSHCGKKD